jgi:hypothetical protein
MNGITTAITLYILAALGLPNLIRNRTYYFAAISALILIISLGMFDQLLGPGAFDKFAAIFIGLFQICAILLLVASSGQMNLNELKSEFGSMAEMIQHGEARKDIKVPLSAAAWKPVEDEPPRRKRPADEDENLPKTYTIDDPATPVVPPPPTPPSPLPPKSQDHGPLPLS